MRSIRRVAVMSRLRCAIQPHFLRGLRALLLLVAAQGAWAGSSWLHLRIPGEPLSHGVAHDEQALSGWFAVSVRDGALVVERAGAPVPSDTLVITGPRTDQWLAGQALQRPGEPSGLSVKAAADSLLLMRLEPHDGGSPMLTPGRYPGRVDAGLLREGWSATAEIGGRRWSVAATVSKRPDGKLLAGSLALTAQHGGPAAARLLLLPPAGPMAFARQELLWLGDLNDDGQPDLLVRRTWVTGEVDFVLVITPMLGTARLDPDRPAHYFSSGVEPDSNALEWHQGEPLPAPIRFIGKGAFSLGEDAWRGLLPEPAAPWPKLLADRSFKLDGETIRITLEHLPRAKPATPSSQVDDPLMGSVLVKLSFRGRMQVLMQAASPSDGWFALSVGWIDGVPGVMIDHQPHYNNRYTQYWAFDESTQRFRRRQVHHSQGC